MCGRSTRWLVHAVVVLALAGSTAARAIASGQAAEPTDPRVVGTWRLNVAKSKFSPGPPYREELRIYEPQPNGIKSTIKRTYANGQTRTIEWVANYDSMEYPVTGSPDYDAIKLKRVDDFTAESVLGHAGRVIATTRRVISRDGRSMTITFQADDFGGSRVDNMMVYDREK